jgi:hypothetical protein
VAEKFALVLEVKVEETIRSNLAGGMCRTEAQEQAERDWYLMEEGEDEDCQTRLPLQ